MATVAWRGRYLLVGGLVAGVAAALVATALATKVYEATALVQVQPQQSTAGVDVLGLQEASQGLATTYATLLGSPSFLERLRPHVDHGRISAGELGSRIAAHAITDNTQNTNLLELTASGTLPAAAARLAGEVAKAFVSVVASDSERRVEQQQLQIQDQIAAQTTRLAALARLRPTATVRAEIGSAADLRATLRNQLQASVAASASGGPQLEIVGPPVASSSPVRPRRMLNLVVGALLGLILGAALAWLRSLVPGRAWPRMRGRGRAGNPPVLARIRQPVGVERVADTGALTSLAAASESVVAVVACTEGNGPSATAESLARAAARCGRSVLVVDGDSSRDGFSARMLSADGVAAGAEDESGSAPRRAPSIRPLVRRLPRSPGGRFNSEALADLLAHAREAFDLVIVTTPLFERDAPTATALASVCDVAILVARQGRRARRAARKAAAAVGAGGTSVLGLVTVEPRRRARLAAAWQTLRPAFDGGTRVATVALPDEPEAVLQPPTSA